MAITGQQVDRRILVVGPSWVGDMVMAQALISLLRHKRPDAHITVMAPAWSRALVNRMPEVDASLDSPFGHGELALLRRYRLGSRLRGRFDVAIILPNSFKSALIPYFANIPVRVGWRGEHRNLILTDCRKLDPRRHPLMVQRFVALGVEPGNDQPGYTRPCLDVDREAALTTAGQLGLEVGERVLAVCPGAEFGESKQWPAAHYARLCELAASAGWHVWILGSANDQVTAAQLLSLVGESAGSTMTDLTGNTSLDQAIDLLSLATVTVTNDSGLMHIAAAVGSPLVALYGSTSPDFTPPLADRVKSLWTDIECRPCFARTCPLGHKKCLTEITPERVYASLQELSSS